MKRKIMTYEELGFNSSNNEITITEKVEKIATINIDTGVQYEIAMLYLDMDKIVAIHEDVLDQYKVINNFVKLVTRLLTEAISHNGIGSFYDDYTVNLFFASIDPYIHKDGFYCYMKSSVIGDNENSDVSSLVSKLLQQVTNLINPILSDDETNIPCALDVAYDVGGLSNYDGWVVHKVIGIDILVLIKI